MLNKGKYLLLCLLFSVSSLNLNAQRNKGVSIKKIDKADVIAKASALLKDQYLYEEVGIQMGQFLQKQLENGAYDELETAQQFGRAMTRDLRGNFKDKHVGFRFEPRMIKRIKNGAQQGNIGQTQEEVIQELIAIEKFENFRLPEIKRLPGNVGYLKLDMILPPGYNSGYDKKVMAVMEYLSDTEGLILDLRENPGGYAEGNQYWLTHFLASKTLVMNSIRRVEGQTVETQDFTLEEVPGKTYRDKPLYILISNLTGSAAEAISHILKYSGRATLVGEATIGAGYSFDDVFVDDNYLIQMSNSAGIHPNATENWEGEGVQPDVEVKAEDALKKAQLLIVRDLLEKEKAKSKNEQYEYRLNALEWEKNRLDAMMNTMTLSEAEMRKYVGKYESRSIELKNGQLYYSKENPRHPARLLIPVKPNQFLIEGRPDMRLSFDLDKQGNVMQIRLRSLTRLYIDKKEN